jgi:hypothetical protein
MNERRPKEISDYSGDDPLALAQEIEMALEQYGRGGDRRLLEVIHFFEGELRLIAKSLRIAARNTSKHGANDVQHHA